MLRSSKNHIAQSGGQSDVQSPNGKANGVNGSASNNNNRKFWGEEVLDDAIYNVYLKKITYSCRSESIYGVPNGSSAVGNGTSNGSGVTNSSQRTGTTDQVNGSLVDGLQRTKFFSKDVFRRKSLDKGFYSNKSKRSASTSDMIDLARNSGSANGSPTSTSRSRQNQPFNDYPSSSSSSSVTASSSDGIKMKNYQKILTETFPSRTSPTKLSSHQQHKTLLELADDADPTSSLQWETRQIRILKAATLDHIVQYILHLTRRQQEQELKEVTGSSSHFQSVVMEEERNNVSHVMHVLFIAYRSFSSPSELFNLFQSHSSQTCTSHQQFNFVLLYWLNNYPEDFMSSPGGSLNNNGHNSSAAPKQTTKSQRSKSSTNLMASNDQPLSLPVNGSLNGNGHTSPTPPARTKEPKSLPSPITTKRSESSRRSGLIGRDRSASASRRSSSHHSREPTLIDSILSIPKLDEAISRKAISILESSKLLASLETSDLESMSNGTPSKATPQSNILELDARFVAQQLTAIDLEFFLSLKPYSLLEGTRANPRVQSTIKNFNLLSRHVIVTILKANSPDVVTAHWIEIALNLRRMKNFNSLKAVIAGLTNESVYRLKNTVWSKLSRSSSSNFKVLSSIVDDVNNQSVLRQTQLDMEGTAKASLTEESFGTIPYLGTFFTDLTVLDSMFATFIESKKSGKKLINLEKCSKQFEVITQVQLLQKNIRAALAAHHSSTHLNGVSSSPSLSSLMSSSPSMTSSVIVPRVARLFRNWFNDSSISALSENDCYKMSQVIEPPTPKK